MIPLSVPSLNQAEADLLMSAIQSGWISSLGPYIEEFEKRYAKICGVNYALAVSNGTTGLHLALHSLGVGPGDEVIIPDLTFVATANAVMYCKAKPIPVDVCRDSYCIDPEKIYNAITPKTKAIIPVHIYGHPADMGAIIDIAREKNLLVIEDAAEAHGASINGRQVGSFGDCGVFSFYANKILTTGEGGLITTNDKALYIRMKHLRDHAMSSSKKYWHDEVGFNYRMTNLQAAIGVAQIDKLNYFLDERSKILNKYKNILVESGVECNPSLNGACPVNWMVCAIVPGLERAQRDHAIELLRKIEVDSRPFFYPISKLPMYKNILNEINPISLDLSNSGINLPTYVGISDAQIEEVAEKFISVMKKI
ncbi:DegT/DnrJ/EryC1/StrS aminotransferase family protein [Polynucleobacter sp. CS-Odin-A6]|uniref:DegT/DnrJ/EryC1/StrS family aminotransferase n=1 Tax=Polynucleobacter sp. CS-Odin-A6 TaxID=2689106 RepID=UPI001C0B81E5|nr:DegT/DnrJ/EryC1/StrS family aminotransferase [Polynucleobacter sp. CS-Odin-A6]MBU3621115.1 DegT/DnrJ/EryC1/StrS family aminotransferase [Polynucleobacter sp. CS-Odin-A6]